MAFQIFASLGQHILCVMFAQFCRILPSAPLAIDPWTSHRPCKLPPWRCPHEEIPYRPPSRADVLNINKSVKNKKTKAGRKLSGTVRKSSCVVGNLDTAAGNGGNHQQQIQASTSSSTPIKKKKPVKRIIQ